MVEHAHTTAAPDVARVSGSSSPTGSPPAFEAVATAPASQVAAVAFSGPDAPLFALIASHAPALAASTKAEVELDAARERFEALEPQRPAAILYRFDDPSEMPEGREKSLNGFRMVYTESDIEKLRSAPVPFCFSSGAKDSPEGAGMAWRPSARGIARRAEILEAFDAWDGERVAVAAQVGWTAARAEVARLAVELRQIENAILDCETHTLAGVQAKGCWIEQQDMVEEWSYYVLYDVIGLDHVTSHTRVA